MAVPAKDYFKGNQVLFVGLSRNPGSFSRMVYKTFCNSGIDVFPINPNGSDGDDIKVYNSAAELEQVPETAYILLDQEKTGQMVEELAGLGVKQFLFQNKSTVSAGTLDFCASKDLETAIACPMMILSNGLIHRIHKFFANRKS